MKARTAKQAVALLSMGLVFGAALLNTQCTSTTKPTEPAAKPAAQAVAPGGCADAAFTIDPNSNPGPWVPPTDIPGGAASASLKDAAIFAWQEFVALNWPAVAQTGQLNTRDQPDPSTPFANSTGPLVWHTFRHKVEIFPGMGQPHGYAGSNASTFYGYDDLPQYVYQANSTPNPDQGQPWIIPADGQIPSFASLSGPTPTPTSTPTTPWINLDEQSEIGLDTMFAGTLTSPSPTPAPFPGSQILFLAKANRTQYTYVAANGWWDGSAPTDATNKYILGFYGNPQAYAEPTPGSSNLVAFPNNTIEVKSAWRQLTAKEAASNRFYTTTVRFYNVNSAKQVGYIDAVWGLVALHIIQKTQSAPYFIYATFSQADNLLAADGSNVEDADGNLLQNQGATSLDPNITATPASTPVGPQTLQKFSPTSSNLTLQTVGQRLFYTNTSTDATPQGLIALNRREHNIPPCIIDVNKAAHAGIKAYGSQNGNGNPVWLYYKLINVQYQPYDKPPGTIYTGAPGGPDPSTYYQANEVVETDYNLQVFSGRFQQPLPTPSPVPSPYQPPNTKHLITDYNLNNTPFYNVYYSTSAPNSGKAANMGGCMGCHGNAQVAGADFSFILLGGPVAAPDVATGPSPSAAPSAIGETKFRKLLLRQ